MYLILNYFHIYVKERTKKKKRKKHTLQKMGHKIKLFKNQQIYKKKMSCYYLCRKK